MKTIYLTLIMIGFQTLFVGCAYFKDGATTKIKLKNNDDTEYMINGQNVDKGVSEVELRNKSDYQIERISEKDTIYENVDKKFNSSFIRNVIMWPYVFVDMSLGSHLDVKNGSLYQVANNSFPIADDCELRNRDKLKKSIYYTWSIFMVGSMFGLASAAYAEEENPKAEITIPLSILAWSGLVGTGYNVYRTGYYTGKINDCIEKRVWK